MELLTTHNNEGGSAPVGGIWYLQSSCSSPITLNGVSYNDGDIIQGGDNPDIDLSTVMSPCEIIFEYRYGECLITDTLTINIESGQVINISTLNNYACGDVTSININTTSSYIGDVIINELDQSLNIISSQTVTYTPTLQVGLSAVTSEQQRIFNIETISGCSSTSENFIVYQAPTTMSLNCTPIEVCAGETTSINLNDYITTPSVPAGSGINLIFRWTSTDTITLTNGTVIGFGDEFTTIPSNTINTATLTTDASFDIIVEYSLQDNISCLIEAGSCVITVEPTISPTLSQSSDYICRWSDFGSVYLSPQLVPNGSYTIYETDEFGAIQSIFNSNSDGTLLLTSLNEGTFYYTFEDNNASCGTQSDVFTLNISPELQTPTCMEIMACSGESVNLNDGITGGSGVTINYQITNSPIVPIPLIGGGTVNIGDDYVPSMGLIDTNGFSNNDTITYQVTSNHTLSDGTECQRVTNACDVKIMACVAPCTDYTTAFTTSPNIININHITSVMTGLPIANYIATWENLNTGDTFQSANGTYVTSSTFEPDTTTQVPVTSGNWQITLVEVDNVVINCLLSETFMISSSSCDSGTVSLNYDGPGGITATEFDFTINSVGVTDILIQTFAAQTVPDDFEVFYEGALIFSNDTNVFNGSIFNEIFSVTFNVDTFITVRISNTNPNINTIWFLNMRCIECDSIICPTELPALHLVDPVSISNDCSTIFNFNRLNVGDCELPFDVCRNTQISGNNFPIGGCITDYGGVSCIDDTVTFTNVTTNSMDLTFGNPTNATNLFNLYNGLSSTELITITVPLSATKTCQDDGTSTQFNIFSNYVITQSGSTLSITRPANPYSNDCSDCSLRLQTLYGSSSFLSLIFNNGGSISSYSYNVGEVTVSTQNSRLFEYYWEEDNCARLSTYYYILITDISDPLNNWEIWEWGGAAGLPTNFPPFNNTNWTLYMNNNAPINDC